MKLNTILLIIILLLLVGGGSFFAGMKYQQSKLPNFGQFRGAMGPQGTPGVQQRGMGAVRGEIISQDEGSITVKLADDSSKIVLISEETEITKASEGSTDDLEVGKQVMVFGEENSDGSVSAENVQINPLFQNLGRPGE